MLRAYFREQEMPRYRKGTRKQEIPSLLRFSSVSRHMATSYSSLRRFINKTIATSAASYARMACCP